MGFLLSIVLKCQSCAPFVPRSERNFNKNIDILMELGRKKNVNGWLKQGFSFESSSFK